MIPPSGKSLLANRLDFFYFFLNILGPWTLRSSVVFSNILGIFLSKRKSKKASCLFDNRLLEIGRNDAADYLEEAMLLICVTNFWSKLQSDLLVRVSGIEMAVDDPGRTYKGYGKALIPLEQEYMNDGKYRDIYFHRPIGGDKISRNSFESPTDLVTVLYILLHIQTGGVLVESWKNFPSSFRIALLSLSKSLHS